jgi:arylsulfatase
MAAPARRPPPRALLAAVLLAAGCAAPPSAPRYEDWVAEGQLASNLAGGEAEQVHCGFETRFARPLRPGEVLTAEADLGAEPRLALALCGRGAGPGAAGELIVSVTAAGGAALEDRWPLAAGGGWQRRELDLGALAGERVTVRLEADLDRRGRLYLEQLVLAHRVPAPERRGRPPQVLLISADTLRDDAVGSREGGPATPALDRLAAGGERFTPHYAGATWTKPSHAVLLTGYGVGVLRTLALEDTLPGAVPTLAERFRAAGFRTGGLVHDCVWLDAKYGFDRGFEDYRAVKWGAEQQARAAVDWMTARRGEPFFFFLHLFDVHSDFHRLPYEAPGVTPETVERRFGVPDYGCRRGLCASALLRALGDGRLEPEPRDAEILRFLYDRGVERLDAALGGLFADLAAAGLYDDLLIAFTADHGEAFFEHGRWTHSTWHEEVLRVPLIVKWPRGERAGAVRRAPAGAADVAPTLLAAAGAPARGLPGADLRTRRADRPVYAGTYVRVVIQGSMKAVFPLDQAPPALFDLAADPGERHDLTAERPDELARLRRLLDAEAAAEVRLRRQIAAAETPGRAVATAEERARLRALGYVDGGGGERSEPREP